MSEQGAVSFIEMGSGDVEKTARFFTSLFGWPYAPMDSDNGVFDTPNGKVGLHGDDPDWGVVPYLRVEDVEAAAQKVRDLGGEAEDVVFQEGFGKFCNCRDPQGMRFGLHQPV